MDRRAFLVGLTGALGLATVPSFAFGQDSSTSSAASLAIDRKHLISETPEDFVGLSYESAQLGDPGFFSPSNRDLIAFFRLLSPSGVLRIGGNTSEYTDWSDDAGAFSDHAAVSPDTGHASLRRTTITPEAVRNLAGFCEATGWRLIYGLNLGTGAPDKVADEASYVSKTLGASLFALQIGNEPDLFHRNGIRAPAYGFTDYLREWTAFADAVVKRNPYLRFAGPDVAGSIDWIEQFAAALPDMKQRGITMAMLSGHHYAEGPPSKPESDIPHLLQPSVRLADDLVRIGAASRSAGIPFRMTETNSCYGGGKEGVSDTFASALWGADYMLQLAQAGVAGVNFHGGGNGHYTPIAGSLTMGFSARPLYYGILAAARFSGKGFLAATLSQAPETVTAYAAQGGRKTYIAIVNKDPEQPVTVGLDFREPLASSVWRLAGPSLDSTMSATLAQAEVGDHGDWHPQPEQHSLAVAGANNRLSVPAGSAAVLVAG